MIKKLLFTLILAGASVFAFAQCTPDPAYTAPGIYPDSATNFDTAWVATPYSQLVTAVIPDDTTDPGPPAVTITFAYFQLVSLTGLPAGLSYACNPSNCQFNANGAAPGYGTGCAIITGTTTAPVGIYPLVIIIKAYGTSFFGPILVATDTLTYYKIVVANTSGIPVLNNEIFGLGQNVPNPACHKAEIEFTSPKNDEVKFRVFDILGNTVVSQIINAKSGLNTISINVHQMPAGLYLYSIDNGETTLTRRMMVGKKD